MFSKVQMNITKQFRLVINLVPFYSHITLIGTLKVKGDKYKIRGFMGTILRLCFVKFHAGLQLVLKYLV